MLDKIHNNGFDAIEQKQNIEKINEYGISNPFKNDESNFFVDESYISNEAFNKYQKEIDIKFFSEMLKNTDQREADNLVIQQAFDGLLSLDSDDFLA